VELEEVDRLDNRLRIQIAEPGNVRFTTEFIGANSKLLSRTFDNPAEYRLRSGDGYVRARVTDSNGRQAWVQPLFER
jgi:hypothetical protein